MENTRTPILQLEHIEKAFPGVKALKDISISVDRGEVRALVGENGAGKSTLMKVLTGVISRDAGRILIDGKEVNIVTPLQAQKLGLSIIFQEFNLINSLSISENIFINRLPRKGIRGVDWAKTHSDAKKLLDRVGLKADSRTLVGTLSVAEKQMVEIAKALSFAPKILIMDEPSATLTNVEIESLFKIIEDLKRSGVTVIYISHRLEEIFRVCDSVTVVRDGEVIQTSRIEDITKNEIISLMVGRSLDQEFPRRNGRACDETVLEVRGLCRHGFFEDVNFTLRKGERLGIAGLVGSGRTEILRAVFGADRADAGEVLIHGAPVTITSPREAIAHKMGMLTEDRKTQGLVLESSIGENITLAALRKIGKKGFLSRRTEKTVAADYLKVLQIKAPDTGVVAMNLSGGNQQKVVVAKWLYTDAEILILDEPTRGIDVGAKYEIYQLINRLADEGRSIIIISSETSEVIEMSDRLLVVHEGRIRGELCGADMTSENIMKLAILEEAKA